MIIKKKQDIYTFLNSFESIASYDECNNKFYFVFPDKLRAGQYTLMKTGENWSIHGKGDYYCDIHETFFHDVNECIFFIWKNRGSINKMLREPEAMLV